MTTLESHNSNRRFGRATVFAWAVTFALAASFTAHAQDEAGHRAGVEFFESNIRPVLVQRCYKCHSAAAEELQAGLSLDSRAGMTQGGDSGPALVAGQPAESLLLQALRYEDLEMPPDGKLPDGVIANFERWIDMGAPDPRTLQGPPARSRIDWDQARQFWSFRKIVKRSVPSVVHRQQVFNAIDAFMLRKLESAGLTLNDQADRRTLIRRVYFDLVGLPPTPQEVNAFLYHKSPIAYEELVDRLLSSPHYGERWGRHWLDVAGYAESNGIIGDGLIPHAWRYRDYVIRALNKDTPYDRFLLEQIAGDELVDWRDAERMTEDIEESLTATGFLRCTPDGTDNQNIFQLEKQWDHIHATVEVALKATMGIVLNCARCHDHKFDPVRQEDYYKVVGLFLPAYDPDNWVPCTDFTKLKWPVRYIIKGGKTRREAAIQTFTELAHRVKTLQSERARLHTRFQDRWLIGKAEAGELPLTARQLDVLKSSPDEQTVENQRVAANLRARHTVADKDLREQFPEFSKRIGEIDRQVEDDQKEIANSDGDMIWALWDVSPEPPVSRLLNRGDFLSPGRAVPAGIPHLLDDPEHPFVLPEPGPVSTSYRLALARWLVRPNHPLTARVMVNRVWHYHFGRGIVATPDDFGSQGARPTHPELLDWLATWFIENGWSVKALHRLIVTSAVYRQSCEVNAEKSRVDPENLLLSRRTPRRLEAELLRDAMLATGESLDRRLFGPPVDLQQSRDGQYIVAPNDPGKNRRSVYIRVRRTTPVSFLETFDAPMMDTNVPHRFNSTVPLQSLALMNNPFVVKSAEDFARRLMHEEPDHVGRRIETAFEIVYARKPRKRELETSLRFFEDDKRAAAWALFCQALIASNEFLYVN